MYRLVGAGAMALALSGCGFTSQSVKEDFAFQSGNQTGLVVLSTRLIDDCAEVLKPVEKAAAINLDYVSQDAKEVGFFILKNFLISNDFTDPDGYFYVRDLPAGHYKVTGFERAGVDFERSHGSVEPMAFEVKAGTVRYLGELTVHIGKCGDTMKLEQKAVFKVSDQRKRDAALFDARMKNLSSRNFEYAILGK